MSKSTIFLSCLAAVGVVATSILAAKETPKALKLLEEAERNKGEKLTTLEVVKVAGPSYVPAVLTGVSTIACIFGATALNHRQQASMISSYAMLDRSFKEYRKKIEERYGDGTDSEVIEDIAKERYDEITEQPSEGEVLFWDYNTLQYFTAKMEDVVQKAVMEDGMECYIIATPFANDIRCGW